MPNESYQGKPRNFMFISLTIFLGLPKKTKVGKGIRSIRICHLWVLTGFSAESEKKSVVWKFLKSLNTRLPAKRYKN